MPVVLSTIYVPQLAKFYDEAPDEFSQITPVHLKNIRQVINKQFCDLSQKVYFEFVDYEPYGKDPSLTDMLHDFYKGKIMIHTTGNDSKVWGKFHNLQFRAIHDFIHCESRLDFTHNDEKKVLEEQLRFTEKYREGFPCVNWGLYENILRSEIVYQSAYKEHFGEFHINQKVILSNL